MHIRLAIFLALTALLVAGCGEKDEPEVTGPPVVTDPGGGKGEPQSGGVALEEIGEFEDPVFVTQPKGDTALYVVEQTGQVIRVSPSGKQSTLLDISDEIVAGGEQGLLSVAFAPDYARSGLFYVDYTNTNGDTRVVEYQTDEKTGKADERSARTLLEVPQPFANHNGGLLLFDDDGNLLVGLGDGGSAGDPDRNGQNLSALLGKILRIDPGAGGRGEEYGVPKDNPYVNENDARPEILAYGLRNPWRFSFDSKDRGALDRRRRPERARGDRRIGGAGAGRELRLVRLRGHRALQLPTRRRRTRSTPCSSTAGTRAARSRAATSCATVRSARSMAATSTPTSARDS